MEEVFFLVSKSGKDRVLNYFLKKGDKINEFYLYKEKKDAQYVNQIISIDENTFDVDLNKDIFDEILRINSRFANRPNGRENYKLIESQNLPGKFYNRIYIPTIEEDELPFPSFGFNRIGSQSREIQKKFFNKIYFPSDKYSIVSTLNQLSILTNSLNLIFQTVQPDEKNLEVYGYNIRNLLILACTEVETQLKGILVSNEYKLKSKTLSTKDYSILKNILKLDQYKVKLEYFPRLDAFSPFNKWSEEDPTKTLTWYNDYHAVKHDRENDFNKSTLTNAINAISAIAILFYAQFGEQQDYWREHIGGFFNIIEKPNWSIEEKYIPPIKGADWEANKYFDNDISNKKK